MQCTGVQVMQDCTGSTICGDTTYHLKPQNIGMAETSKVDAVRVHTRSVIMAGWYGGGLMLLEYHTEHIETFHRRVRLTVAGTGLLPLGWAGSDPEHLARPRDAHPSTAALCDSVFHVLDGRLL